MEETELGKQLQKAFPWQKYHRKCISVKPEDLEKLVVEELKQDDCVIAYKKINANQVIVETYRPLIQEMKDLMTTNEYSETGDQGDQIMMRDYDSADKATPEMAREDDKAYDHEQALKENINRDRCTIEYKNEQVEFDQPCIEEEEEMLSPRYNISFSIPNIITSGLVGIISGAAVATGGIRSENLGLAAAAGAGAVRFLGSYKYPEDRGINTLVAGITAYITYSLIKLL